jgi:hypothetical protein
MRGGPFVLARFTGGPTPGHQHRAVAGHFVEDQNSTAAGTRGARENKDPEGHSWRSTAMGWLSFTRRVKAVAPD